MGRLSAVRALLVCSACVAFPRVGYCQNPARDTLRSATAPAAAEAPHWFTAGRVDLGYKYLRPRLSLGHGVPFGQWFGLDVNPLVSSRAVGGYSGLRVSTRHVIIRSGASYTYSFDRSFLPIRDRYTRETAELRTNDESARYWGTSTELTLNVPIFGGNLNLESEAYGVIGAPRDRYVFVEALRVVGGGSWVLRQRVAYAYPVHSIPGLMLGVGAEVLVLPVREEQVWRAGVLGRWWLYPNLGLRLAVMPVVAGPDSLGLVGAEFELGVRWLWSTD